MGGHFVFIPDQPDPPSAERVELFAGVADVNTVPQVAEAFGVCAQTVRRLIARGELETVHIGRSVRVTRQAMIRFIEGQGVQA